MERILSIPLPQCTRPVSVVRLLLGTVHWVQIWPGSKIAFAPGVTVVFGENGSGKSGFVRVLERAAGVRTAEDILHNVRNDKRPTPSASFTVTTGTVTQTIPWKNEFGIVPMNRVSIFDARGARLHLEDDLTYVYTPGELSLFPLVSSKVL